MNRPIQTPSLALILLVSLLLGACTSSSGSGLGRMPTALVDLYDRGQPDGVLEIELERDGRVRGMEVDIAPSELPRAVLAVVLQRMPGAQVTGAEREINKNGRAWEVKLRHEGRAWEFVVDGEGNVIETEKELTSSEVPVAVSDAVEQAMPGGELISFELVESPARSEYHVKKRIAGASYKLVVAPNGRLIRKVREARAEIEIPLAE